VSYVCAQKPGEGGGGHIGEGVSGIGVGVYDSFPLAVSR